MPIPQSDTTQIIFISSDIELYRLYMKYPRHMILPVTWYESMHHFAISSIPSFDKYYLHICAWQLFCMLFLITFIYIVSNYILYSSCHFMHTYQQQILSCNRCTMTSTCFMMYLGSYRYFDFNQNSPSYPWSLHTTYSDITLTIS